MLLFERREGVSQEWEPNLSTSISRGQTSCFKGGDIGLIRNTSYRAIGSSGVLTITHFSQGFASGGSLSLTMSSSGNDRSVYMVAAKNVHRLTSCLKIFGLGTAHDESEQRSP